MVYFDGKNGYIDMFLSNIVTKDPDLHELDFRFEYDLEEDVFLLVHHGVTLHELLEVCGSDLGSTFYLFEMRDPVKFEDVLKGVDIFEQHFKVLPSIVEGKYLSFDTEKLESFFKEADAITFVDCALIGNFGEVPTDADIENIVKDKALSSFTSIIHTHDNHFLWVKARSLNLLRRIINASLIGFFNHVQAHVYKEVPSDLIDLIVSKYHTTSLVCQVDVQMDENKIQALLETSESHWTSSRQSFPKEMHGRGLLISYNFKEESWSFQEWS